MNQPIGNTYPSPYDPQDEQGQWTWYRQYPAMGYAGYPSYDHHHRMLEEILHRTREHHRLLRDIHRRLHHPGMPSPFGTAGTETMTFGVPTDMRKEEPRP